MQTTDLSELSRRLTQIVDVLGGRAPTEAGLQVWFDALRECAMADVLSVLTDWPKEHSKAPTPADVLRAARSRMSDRLERESLEHRKAPGFNIGRLAANSVADPEIARRELAKIHAILASKRGESVKQKATRINREVLTAPTGTYSELRIKAAREFLGRVGAYTEADDDREARLERDAIQATN